MKTKPNLFSIIKQWRHISGYYGKKVTNEILRISSDELNVVEYVIEVNPEYGLKGKSILFFADLHFPGIMESSDFFIEIIRKSKPDWIVFGGDLVTYACFIDDAFTWLKRNFGDFKDIPKVAVAGNWDRRRTKWFPQKVLFDKYREAGFELLINDSIQFGEICFHGIDDSRIGKPVLKPGEFDPSIFNCIVSHSIEPVIEKTTEQFIPGDNLALCGHTHAGQIRIPFFGALFTSTKYWKLFEYGLYKHQKSNLNLIMTSGIGTSRLPIRLFCEPEVIVIRFIDN